MNHFWIFLALVVAVSCEKPSTEKPALDIAKHHDSVDHHHFPAKVEQILPPPKKQEKPNKDLKQSDSIGIGFYAGLPISYGYYPYYPYYRRPYYGYYGVHPGFGFRAYGAVPIVGGGVVVG